MFVLLNVSEISWRAVTAVKRKENGGKKESSENSIG